MGCHRTAGGDLLEESTALKAHKDFMFWFYAYEFKLPGIYTLRWRSVVVTILQAEPTLHVLKRAHGVVPSSSASSRSRGRARSASSA